jgi:hypothetical protein
MTIFIKSLVTVTLTSHSQRDTDVLHGSELAPLEQLHNISVYAAGFNAPKTPIHSRGQCMSLLSLMR